jgi:hypothetical protein
VIAQEVRAQPLVGGDVSAPEGAVAAEQRFLDGLRRRVAWQAHAAARLRAERPPAQGTVDVLDVAALERLLAAHASALRAREWRLFLDELVEIADPGDRLPPLLERLVRVVFGELLEER